MGGEKYKIDLMTTNPLGGYSDFVAFLASPGALFTPRLLFTLVVAPAAAATVTARVLSLSCNRALAENHEAISRNTLSGATISVTRVPITTRTLRGRRKMFMMEDWRLPGR